MPSPHTNCTKQAQAWQPLTGPMRQAQPQQARPQPANPAAIDPEVVAHYAQVVRRDLYPAYLFASHMNGIMADAPLAAFRKYVDEYVLDAAGSDCKNQPILRTLIEQLLLLHQTIGRLQGDALAATTIEQRRINLQLAAQLTGELRRLAEEIEKIVQSRRKERLPFPAAKSEKSGGVKSKVGSKHQVA